VHPYTKSRDWLADICCCYEEERMKQNKITRCSIKTPTFAATDTGFCFYPDPQESVEHPEKGILLPSSKQPPKNPVLLPDPSEASAAMVHAETVLLSNQKVNTAFLQHVCLDDSIHAVLQGVCLDNSIYAIFQEEPIRFTSPYMTMTFPGHMASPSALQCVWILSLNGVKSSSEESFKTRLFD
ncbi:hypothetical protein STEG23_003518, partial [Scotinomys teguina]